MKNKRVLMLTESAIMLALATILSIFPIIRLPFDGTVTFCSMLPVMIIAYRHGVRWGVFTGFVYGMLQMLLGAGALAYATSTYALIAIIVFDFVVSFAAIGLAGIFRRMSSQSTGLVLGVLTACIVRYASHVISGCTVWAGISIPTGDSLLYSLAYNASYMLPETLIAVVGAVCLSQLLDFRSQTLTSPVRKTAAGAISIPALVLSLIEKAVLIFIAVFTCASVFPLIQSADGGLDAAGLALVNWSFTGIIIAVSVLGIVILRLFQKLIKTDNSR